MADRKITDLTALTTPASADVLPIVDVSEAAAADKNKKITVGELFKGVPDGTAAAPAIAFESDDGNGIFLSTTDTVGIATNGSSRMTVSTTAVTSTLPVIVPDGTAAAPSVAFTGSGTDTGFYSDAANTLAASTGGTNALYIDSSQRVGIGTASPQAELHVSDTSGDAEIRMTSEGTTGSCILRFGNSNDQTLASIRTTSGTDQLAFFGFNDTERMRIDSSGRLLVGTSANDNNAPLTVCRTGGGGSTPAVGSDTIATFRATGGLSHEAVISVLGGSSGASQINLGDRDDEDTAYIRSEHSNNSLQFAVNGGTESLRIDSSGNVGIGTTSVGHKLDVQGDSDNIVANLRGRTGDDQCYLRFATNDSSTANALIGVPSANTLSLITGGSERARIDSSGRLLVGTSTARSPVTHASRLQVEGLDYSQSTTSIISNASDGSGPTLLFGKSRSGSLNGNTVVQDGDDLGQLYFCGADGSDLDSRGGIIKCQVDGTPGANDMPGRLIFGTTADGGISPTERMRLTQDGRPLFFSALDAMRISSGASAGTSYSLLYGMHSGTGVMSPGTTSITILTNGNIQNTNNSYGAISDIKLKENIVDASSQWDDLKALRVRNYNFKEETGQQTHTQLGVVAQEVELISPGLVTESPDRDEDGNDLGTVTKSVNYSVLYMKAVKALQEAMERIETLEAKVAALEGA